MKRAIMSAAMLGALLAGCATNLPSDNSLSKTTSRTLPEREVARRVTAQLTDILLPQAQQAPNPEAKNALMGLTYDMPGRPAYNAAGICMQSYAAFAFEPSAPREGADTRVRVSSVQTHFQIVVPERRDTYADVPTADHSAVEKLCERYRDAPAYARFVTNNEYSGIAAFKAFEALRTALATQPDFPLDCADYPANGIPCRVRLTRLTAADIVEGVDCGRDRQQPRPNRCVQLLAGDYALQIFVDQAGVPQYALADELIIMSHPRHD
jgi:hypothetical protein